MQMVANGYGVTLVPQVAVDVEVRDERVKLLRFVQPAARPQIGPAWRRTSPRKADFVALGQIIAEALGVHTKGKPAALPRAAEARVESSHASGRAALAKARSRHCAIRRARSAAESPWYRQGLHCSR